MSSFSLSLSSLKRVVAVKKSKEHARKKKRNQAENIRFLSLSLFSNRQSFNISEIFLTFSEYFSAKVQGNVVNVFTLTLDLTAGVSKSLIQRMSREQKHYWKN